MTDPLTPPARKNPARRSRVPVLPPAVRSRTAQLLTEAAAQGRFALQACAECGTVIYPPRDACPSCLGNDLPLTDIAPQGRVLADTSVEISNELYFRERAPWRIGLVQLPSGPVLVSHLHADCQVGAPARLSLQLDKAGNGVVFALPEKDTPNMTDDKQWREFSADPKFRRVLISDGRSPVGQAIARAMVGAGATVYLGLAEAWKPFPQEAEFRDREDIHIVPLDTDDEKSVKELASALGGKVDILVNCPDYLRPGNLLDTQGTGLAREHLNRHFLSFVLLSQHFGQAMRARGADGDNSAVAWVNVLSAYALANASPYGTFSAVQAGCLSLSHALRAEMRQGGVRVLNLFTGPVDGEWFQDMPPPKLAPKAVARALVSALQNGGEDIFVGDIAKDIRDRLRDSPKATERELNRDQRG